MCFVANRALSRQITAWIKVPSMMPRPILTSLFALTYRKIPVLAVGRDVYCDTSLIIEMLEQHPSFQGSQHPSIYPAAADGRKNRSLIRLFSSFYTDRAWFRVICGLVPGAVWRSQFGKDRGGLIGHPLDADKLEAKIPSHMVMLNLHLSILEAQFEDATTNLPWLFSTPIPSLADISLFFMLSWGRDISRGILVRDLTGGDIDDIAPELEGMESVFNEKRFPGVWRWFNSVQEYFENLPDSEQSRIELGDENGISEVVERLKAWKNEDEGRMIATSVTWDQDLDTAAGVILGRRLVIAPDDTGRNDPVTGDLFAASSEEVVIRPATLPGKDTVVDNVLLHFPRIGFLIKPESSAGKPKL